MKKVQIADCAVIGFALFGMFFGAGNLIFPPFLGCNGGSNWFLGFICFLIMDIGLSMIAIISICKNGDDARGITEKLGKKISALLLCTNIIFLGPLAAIPRAAATAFEFAIEPVFGSSASCIFGIVFFFVAVILSLKKSGIITVIGSVLAPLMFIALVFLVIKGINTPLGIIEVNLKASQVAKEGILAGYQTMDIMAAVIFSSSIIAGVKEKGYIHKNKRLRVIVISAVIATVVLFLIYGGLTYLGATVSALYAGKLSRAQLLGAIVVGILGDGGKLFLNIIVTLACLTAVIGILSSSSAFIQNMSGGRLSYKKVLIVFAAVSMFISNFGIDTIMSFSAPLLGIICPVLLVIVVLGLLSNHIKSNSVYKITAATALFFSTFSVIENTFGLDLKTSYLPLSQYGFAWLIPTLSVSIFSLVYYSLKNEVILSAKGAENIIRG